MASVPHVGRYRLFQRAPTGPLWVCRVCREAFRKENLTQHYWTELHRAFAPNDCIVSGGTSLCPVCTKAALVPLEARLAYLLRVRRSRRNLRRARWEYAVRKSEERP